MTIPSAAPAPALPARLAPGRRARPTHGAARARIACGLDAATELLTGARRSAASRALPVALAAAAVPDGGGPDDWAAVAALAWALVRAAEAVAARLGGGPA